MDVFLKILEGNGHKRTQREGLCTGTAKSELRYDIYTPAYEVCHGGIMFSSFLCVCLLTIFVSAP